MATAKKNKTKLIPLGDRLVIQPVEQEEVLASGIVIPDTAKEKPQQGDVLAAGPGRQDDDGKPNRNPHARRKKYPRPLRLWDKVLLREGLLAQRVNEYMAYRFDAARKVEQRQEQVEKVWRPGRDDLRVAADDDGVGMVARVAPAPDSRLAQQEERRKIINDVVDPPGLERCAVAALMPARV